MSILRIPYSGDGQLAARFLFMIVFVHVALKNFHVGHPNILKLQSFVFLFKKTPNYLNNF